MSKNVKIILSVACFVVAAGILYFTTFRNSDGGYSSGDVKLWFKCGNPKCNASYSLTPEEFQKKQSQGGMDPMMMMMPGQPMALTCDKCNQKSAYMAQQCTNEKCKEVFVNGQARDPQYPDKCPKCGHSEIAEYEKSQK